MATEALQLDLELAQRQAEAMEKINSIPREQLTPEKIAEINLGCGAITKKEYYYIISGPSVFKLR